MKRHLLEEVQPKKAFAAFEEKVFIEILRTSQVLSREIVEALRPSDLSAPQFNVLRILRGAGSGGLTCGRIGERMLNHDSDLTRLLDRLEARGLVEKSRDAADRRVVNARITKTGLGVVESASEVIVERLRAAMKPVARTQLEQLADLLETVRAGVTNADSKGENNGHQEGSHPRHGSDRASGRSGRAGADREGRTRPRNDAQAGGRRREGAPAARSRNRRG